MTLYEFIEFTEERLWDGCDTCPFSRLVGDRDSEQQFEECMFECCPSNYKANEIEELIYKWERRHE